MSLIENVPLYPDILVHIQTSFTIMTKISYNKRNQIISMHEDGFPGRKIAKALNISHGSVQYNIKKLKKNGSVTNQPKFVCPRSVSARPMTRSRVKLQYRT